MSHPKDKLTGLQHLKEALHSLSSTKGCDCKATWRKRGEIIQEIKSLEGLM